MYLPNNQLFTEFISENLFLVSQNVGFNCYEVFHSIIGYRLDGVSDWDDDDDDGDEEEEEDDDDSDERTIWIFAYGPSYLPLQPAES